jgi:hypothetical protein
MRDTEDLLTGKNFRLSRPGENEAALQLLAGGEIKAPATLQPANWYCDETPEGPALILSLAYSAPLSLRPSPYGDLWSAGDVLLYPADAERQPSIHPTIRQLVAATGFPSPVSALEFGALRGALNLLRHLGIDTAGEVAALAGEHGPGPARDKLTALAAKLSREDVPPPELHLPAEWDVIPTHYTRSKPE